MINNEESKTKPYAYVVNYSGFDELKFIAALYVKNVIIRYSLKTFTLSKNNYNRGSIIITRGDNKHLAGNFDKIISGVANECQVKLVSTTTGMVESGKDFGSDNSPLAKNRSVALLCGDGTSAGSVGELWYFFERELNFPVTLINVNNIDNVNLNTYEVLLLSSGTYSKLKDTIFDYIKHGGRVIAIENAIALFSGEKTTSLAKAIDLKAAELKPGEKKVKSDDSTLLKKFELENERRYTLSERSAGSIYKVKLDDTNPYAFGLGKSGLL